MGMSGFWLLWSLLLLEAPGHSNRLLLGFGLPVEALNHLYRGSHILRQEIELVRLFRWNYPANTAAWVIGTAVPT